MGICWKVCVQSDLDLAPAQSDPGAVASFKAGFCLLEQRSTADYKKETSILKGCGETKYFLFLLPFRPAAFLKPDDVTEEEGSAFSPG